MQLPAAIQDAGGFCLVREAPTSRYVFMSERRAPLSARLAVAGHAVKPDEDQNGTAHPRSNHEIWKGLQATRSAYVYAVLVDGVVRYVGKGRNGRMYSHLIEAKRSAARCAPDRSVRHGAAECP